jgi:hypothetical protein
MSGSKDNLLKVLVGMQIVVIVTTLSESNAINAAIYFT